MIGGFLKRLWEGVRRALRVLTRPVRRSGGLKGTVIQPYRGYGTRQEVYLKGRVFRQPRFGQGLAPGSFLRELSDLLRRLARMGIADVQVTASLGGAEASFVTDRHGYFEVELAPTEPLPQDHRWHRVHLEVTRQGDTTTAEGMVFVPTPSACRLVVSDIDDTVMFTGVANVLRMFWRLFAQGAETRTAFPGVAALYRGLHGGPGGDEGNPLLYVSRAPWSIYEVLQTFFRMHDIPEGPVLFLREWGLTLQHPLPRRSSGHKKEHIHAMLRRYPDLPVILIGDSGQHDPEIYAEIVHAHPGRVTAVYIRDVSDGDRARDIDTLARETGTSGTELVLAEDSVVMADHALEAGFLTPDAREAVAQALEEHRQETEAVSS